MRYAPATMPLAMLPPPPCRIDVAPCCLFAAQRRQEMKKADAYGVTAAPPFTYSTVDVDGSRRRPPRQHAALVAVRYGHDHVCFTPGRCCLRHNAGGYGREQARRRRGCAHGGHPYGGRREAERQRHTAPPAGNDGMVCVPRYR
ncbi:hypothetical protein AVEN_231845-1 [Araneus ventricosus]|uniref:Uncharacterized protein n=1 Tax=Araneus ventricosus TaxID=182803 RepID=A0A4Y2V906_ARAVE|nr:hypothetical protein AVEN_231845-1 [Araneus ventricosus]